MRKVGIDLGTTNLLICVDNEGVVIDEPSVLTVDAQTKKCIAAGKEAVADKLTGNVIKEIYVPKKIVNIVMK